MKSNLSLINGQPQKNKFNYNTVDWWESVVKPGIKDIAITFTRSHNKSKYGELNMLYRNKNIS